VEESGVNRYIIFGGIWTYPIYSLMANPSLKTPAGVDLAPYPLPPSYIYDYNDV